MMADNYAERLDGDQALDLIRLAFDIRATCNDYAVSQPTRKLTNWRHRVLVDMGHARLPTRSTLEGIADQLQLPRKVVDRWIAAHPAAMSDGSTVES